MLMAIDDKPVPQMSSTRFGMTTFGQWPLAKFLIDNLKPDSIITYMDTEIWDYQPSYESLMSYARMILPNYVKRMHYPGTLEMRRACALMVGRVGIHKAAYLQKWVMDDIETQREKNRKQSAYDQMMTDSTISKHMIDSIPNYLSRGTIDMLKGAIPPSAPRRSGKTVAMERVLKGLKKNGINTVTVTRPAIKCDYLPPLDDDFWTKLYTSDKSMYYAVPFPKGPIK